MADQNEETGTEIAQPARSPHAVSVYEQFTDYAKSRAAIEGPMVAEELNTAQMEAILTASTEEELEKAMEMAGLIGLRDLEDGQEIRINGYHYVTSSRSDIAGKLGVFIVMDVNLLNNGERVAVNTGIDRVIGFLRMVESGQIPGLDFPVDRIVRKVGTGSGNELITLRPLPKRVA